MISGPKSLKNVSDIVFLRGVVLQFYYVLSISILLLFTFLKLGMMMSESTDSNTTCCFLSLSTETLHVRLHYTVQQYERQDIMLYVLYDVQVRVKY